MICGKHNCVYHGLRQVHVAVCCLGILQVIYVQSVRYEVCEQKSPSILEQLEKV